MRGAQLPKRESLERIYVPQANPDRFPLSLEEFRGALETTEGRHLSGGCLPCSNQLQCMHIVRLQMWTPVCVVDLDGAQSTSQTNRLSLS